MAHVEDLIEPGLQQVTLSDFPPFPGPHRALPRCFGATAESRGRTRIQFAGNRGSKPRNSAKECAINKRKRKLNQSFPNCSRATR